MSVRVAFAGDREIAVSSLRFLLESGNAPVALLLPDPAISSHDNQLASLCEGTPEIFIHQGQALDATCVDTLDSLNIDVLLSVHYPHIVREPLLSLPRLGCLNLHPAFLPYNRGWHTPSWSILDDTPAGATLHCMSRGVDDGDIVHQKELVISPADTAHTLYQRILALELEVLREAWPAIAAGRVRANPQIGMGTIHKRSDLSRPEIQQIEMDAATTAYEVLRKVRGLTTNRVDESAYFVADGRRYHVQVHITSEELEGEAKTSEGSSYFDSGGTVGVHGRAT